jgi:hypothetical protein
MICCAVKINNSRKFSSLRGSPPRDFPCFVGTSEKENIYFEIKQKRLQENEIKNVMCVL